MSQPLAFNLFRLSDVGWFCFTSHRQRGHLEMAPHLLSLAKDVKLGFNTGNRTPGRRVAVHYTTTAPRHLQALRTTHML